MENPFVRPRPGRTVIAEPAPLVQADRSVGQLWAQIGDIARGVGDEVMRAAEQERVRYLADGKVKDELEAERILAEHPDDTEAVTTKWRAYRESVIANSASQYVQQRGIQLDRLGFSLETQAFKGERRKIEREALASTNAAVDRQESTVLAHAFAGRLESVDIAIGEYAGILNAAVGAGLIPEAEADARLRRMQSHAKAEIGIGEAGRIWAKQGPEAAEQFFASAVLGNPDLQLSAPERLQFERRKDALFRDLDQDRRQAQADQDRQRAEDYRRRLSEITIKVHRGELSQLELEDAYDAGAGWLEPGHFTNLTLVLDDVQQKRARVGEEIARVERAAAGAGLLDPRSEKDRQAVSLHFDRASDGWDRMRPEERAAQVALYVEQVGIVPPALAGEVRATLRRGTPEQIANAAAMVDLIVDRAPWAANDFDGEDFTIARGVARWIEAGAAPAEAVARVTEAMKVGEPERQARRQMYGRAKYRDANPSALRERVANIPGSGAGLLDLTRQAEVPTAMQAEFDELVAERFEVTGDIEVARDVAARTMARTWGVTTIGGRRFQRYAPEAVYGRGADADWIGEQLQADLTAAGATATPDRIRLEPTFATGRTDQPAYVVLEKLDSGEWSPVRGKDGRPLVGSDGRPLLFRPDFATSPEAKRREEEAARAVEKARQDRQRMGDWMERTEDAERIIRLLPPNLRGPQPFDPLPPNLRAREPIDPLNR